MGGACTKINAIAPSGGGIQQNRSGQILIAPEPIQQSMNASQNLIESSREVVDTRTEASIQHHQMDSSGLYFRDAITNSSNLFAAVKRGDIASVKELIGSKNDVNIKGMWSSTPLIIACQFGYDEIANSLLDVDGIDVNHSNEKGATSLLFASMEGKVDLATRIIKLGGSVNPAVANSIYNPKMDKNMACTPLSVACVNGHVEIIRLLLENGCSINESFSFPLTKSIFNQKAPIECENIMPIGLTPIMTACAFGNVSTAKELLTRSSDCFVSDMEGSSILHHITRAGKASKELLELLKEFDVINEVLLNKVDKKGETALHYACDAKQLQVIELLLQWGSNPNVGGALNGITPLHIAVKRRSMEVLSLLLDYGADPTLEDAKGVSAAQAAGQLRKDSPLLVRMEEAATAWRARRAIAGAAEVSQSGGTGPADATQFGGQSTRNAPSQLAPEGYSTPIKDRPILPSRNQVQDIVETEGVISGVDERLSQVAAGATGRPVQVENLFTTPPAEELSVSSEVPSRPPLAGRPGKVSKSNKIVISASVESDAPETNCASVADGMHSASLKPIPSSSNQMVVGASTASSSSAWSSSNEFFQSNHDSLPKKSQDFQSMNDDDLVIPIKEAGVFSTPERVIPLNRNRSRGDIVNSRTSTPGTSRVGAGSTALPPSTQLTPSGVFPVFETPLRTRHSSKESLNDFALLSV